MNRLSLYLLVVLLSYHCATPKERSPKDSPETVSTELSPAQNQAWVDANLDRVMQKKTFAASNGLDMPYRIFIPEGYRKEDALPLLIHLHGRGERGTDNRPRLYNNIPLFTGPNSIVSPNGQRQHPCLVLVPQCSDKTVNEEWAKWVGNTPETPFHGLSQEGAYSMAEEPSESGFAVLELIDSVIAQYNIDQNRVYLTGLSMGGFGTWEYVVRRPELFAAAVPMAGFSDPRKADKIKHIPIWIFHGDADEANPVQGSRNMYKLLKEAGADVRYTEYAGVAHSPTFKKAWAEEAELLPWIFAQRKK